MLKPISALLFICSLGEPANAQVAPTGQIIQSPMVGIGHDQGIGCVGDVSAMPASDRSQRSDRRLSGYESGC